ncbi:hypothetical protein Dimus_020796, partial [Dionaea muscipula]
RQKWENLFKRRELVHVDAVKEFYAKMTVIHLKKKDVVKSKVRGVEMEFDHEQLATILGVPGTNGICEYMKDVWEESKYTKPLEITRRFANDENIMGARRVKSGELKHFQCFVHFLVMKNVVPRFGKRDTSSFLDLTYMDHLMSRRKKKRQKRKMKGIKMILIWKAMIDEATVEGESGSGERFYDAEDKDQGSPEVQEEIPKTSSTSSDSTEGTDYFRSRPLVPYWTNSVSRTVKFQAEFERKRANRFHDDLEKAKAENARLLALLHQA